MNADIGHRPRVTVILPTYNRAYCLSASMAAVLAQSVADFEFLIVDDGSVDNTPACIAAFADPRITRCAWAQNRGKSAAVNHAARRARGEWLMLVDSDDVCWSDRLARQLAAVEADATDGVFARAVFVDRHGRPGPCFPDRGLRIAGRLRLEDNLVRNHVGGGTLLVRRSAFLAVGGFDETLHKSIDRDFALRFLARFTLSGIDDIVIENRISPDGITLNPAPDSLALILKRHADLYRRVPAKRLAHLYCEVGCEYLAVGTADAAAAMFWRAVRLYPSARHRRLCERALAHRPLTRGAVHLLARGLKLGMRLQRWYKTFQPGND